MALMVSSILLERSRLFDDVTYLEVCFVVWIIPDGLAMTMVVLKFLPGRLSNPDELHNGQFEEVPSNMSIVG